MRALPSKFNNLMLSLFVFLTKSLKSEKYPYKLMDSITNKESKIILMQIDK